MKEKHTRREQVIDSSEQCKIRILILNKVMVLKEENDAKRNRKKKEREIKIRHER
jgi:hypothetical protein